MRWSNSQGGSVSLQPSTCHQPLHTEVVLWDSGYDYDIGAMINQWDMRHPSDFSRLCMTSWCFQPIWKICSSNWIISPGRGENKKLKPLPRWILWFYGNIELKIKLQDFKQTLEKVSQHERTTELPGDAHFIGISSKNHQILCLFLLR